MTNPDKEMAREIIEGFDEEICSKCEGSGLVYADRKAHYPHSNSPTVPCSYCHEGKIAISDETRIEMIAQALRSVRQEENKKHEALIGVLVGGLRTARGRLGYGPLETMPSTIKTVRETLDDAISHPLVQEYLKKEEK